MAEELHPIELDNGDVAEEVRQVLPILQVNRDAEQQDLQDDDQPSPAQVFNRIVEFETVLERAWTEFKAEIIVEMSKLRREVHLVRRIVRCQDVFEEGDSVVLLKERKVGKVTYVTDKFVDVVMDDDQKKIRKRKTLVMKLAETQG